MLMGYRDHNLPYDVPANEYLNLEGAKFSTSRGWAAWVPDFLAKYDADALRYALAINLPETRDADFSLSEFIRRNNDELVATYGNLPHRTLTFIQRYFGGIAGPAAGRHPPPVVRESRGLRARGTLAEAPRSRSPSRTDTRAQFGTVISTRPRRGASARRIPTPAPGHGPSSTDQRAQVLAIPSCPSRRSGARYLGYSAPCRSRAGARVRAAGTSAGAGPLFAMLEADRPRNPGRRRWTSWRGRVG